MYIDTWRVVELPDIETTPDPIQGLSVEAFLVKFPEFKALLSDPEYGSDFLEQQLLTAAIAIQFGRWPEVIQIESVYLQLAHNLQRRFEQQSVMAAQAVKASQGDPLKVERTNTASSTAQDLRLTAYGEQLLQLQDKTRSKGGVVV